MALKRKKKNQETQKRVAEIIRNAKRDSEPKDVIQNHQSEMHDILYGDKANANSSRRTASNLEWLHEFQARETAEQARREKIASEKVRDTKECELDRYKIDLSDLLDPRLCQGENFIQNIMKKLGLSGKIINNPRVVYEIENHIERIMRQKNIDKWKGINGEYTREQIEEIVRSIETSDLQYKEPKEGESGFKINQENGSFDIQTFKRGNIYGERYCIEDEEKGTVRMSDLSGGLDIIYDCNGIEMRKVSTRATSKNETTRLLQYPFATKNVLNFEGETYESYSILDLNNLSNFYGENVIRVDSLDDVEKYYKENKEEIEKSFDRIPEEGRNNAKLGNSLKIGLKKIAQKAGILTKQK